METTHATSAVTYDVLGRHILNISPVTNAMQATEEIQRTQTVGSDRTHQRF